MGMLWILIIAVVVLAVWLIASYNKLVTLRTRSEEAWSDIDVQLKRRYDLIPNLVETVKGYATHEGETLARVTAARAAAMQATTPEQHAQAENALSATLKTLFAVAESYPDLKASQNFLQMQDELSDTENKIQAARRFYNSNVRDLNTGIQTFPTNIIANLFSFKPKTFFEIENATEREAVQVKF